MPPKRKMASKSKKRMSRLARALTLGPGPVPIQLQVNGQTLSTTASTWLTLLQFFAKMWPAWVLITDWSSRTSVL
jgi:hypothetical protein